MSIESGGGRGDNLGASAVTWKPGAIDFNGRPEDEKTYWAAVDPLADPRTGKPIIGTDGDRMAAEIWRRVDRYYTFLQASGLYERQKRSYLSRYGMSPDGDNVSYRVVRGGDTGSLTLFHPNHYANTLNHMATLITSSEPDIQAMASNGDSDTVRQVSLANSIMQFMQREKQIPALNRDMVEQALMLGEAWTWIRWDQDAGEDFAPGPDGKMLRTGDIEISQHMPQDVIRDTTALQSRHPQWLVVRAFVNRWDLMAKFPDHADLIMAAQRPTIDAFRIEFQTGISDSDLIPLYQFYHAPSPALPEGRQCTLVSNDALLVDGPLEYGEIPVSSMCPSRILGTNFAYTPMWDMLSLQQILNALYSGMITNHVTFVVRRILMPRGQPIKQQMLGSNLGIIWYDDALEKPELMETPLNTEETMAAIQAIERLFALFSSISDVQRGQVPDQKALSGAAMMLLVNQSLQFMSGLQHEDVSWYEQTFNLMLKILKHRAEAPMFISVAGQGQRAALKTFTKSDLTNVRRIQAEMANPVMHQFAGKMQMVEMLANLGAFGNGPSAGRKIMEVFSTGDWDSVLDQQVSQESLIRGENEMLAQGQNPEVTEFDVHELHEDPFTGHPAVLTQPEARLNPAVLNAVRAHMAQHAAMRAQRAAEQAQEEAQVAAAQAAFAPPPPQMGPGGPPQGNGTPMGAKKGLHPVPPPSQNQRGPNPNMPKMPQLPGGNQ